MIFERGQISSGLKKSIYKLGHLKEPNKVLPYTFNVHPNNTQRFVSVYTSAVVMLGKDVLKSLIVYSRMNMVLFG